MKGQNKLGEIDENEAYLNRKKSGLVDATGPVDQQREELPPAEENSLRAIYENTPVMMQTIGANRQIVSVNRTWLEVLGYDQSEVIGRNPTEFLTEASRRYAETVGRPKLFKTGSVRDIAYQMVNKNGDVIDVLLSAVAEIDADGQFIRSYSYMIVVDEHRTSDELWRQLSLVEERNRMSRDLHDTVEHSLIGIMLRTDTVKELMDTDPLTARAELESTQALAKLGLDQVSRAVWDLKPLAIDSNPLKDVISRGLSRLSDEGIKTSLEVDGEEPKGIDQRNKLAVIRIVQETLSNIRLHSKATGSKIRLSYNRTHLMLLITDDGLGFDPSTTHSALSPSSRGFGLANMRESARLAGGSVNVSSAPDSGTQVEVCIPYEHHLEHSAGLIEGQSDEERPQLTNRELEVLQILAHGGRNKDVAATMFVSLPTVKFHINNLYHKLDVRTRAELVHVATQRGLLNV